MSDSRKSGQDKKNQGAFGSSSSSSRPGSSKRSESPDHKRKLDPIRESIRSGFNPYSVAPSQLGIGVPPYNAALIDGKFHQIDGISKLHVQRDNTLQFASVKWPASRSDNPPKKRFPDLTSDTKVKDVSLTMKQYDRGDGRKNECSVAFTVVDGKNSRREEKSLAEFASSHSNHALQYMMSQFAPSADRDASGSSRKKK